MRKLKSSWVHLSTLSNCKVKGGVLQLTLGIALVISILCSSIILIVYYGKLLFLQQNIESHLRDNATSGIQYVMARRSSLEFKEPQVLDLFGDETDSVEVVRLPWGIFEVYRAKAIQSTHSYVKVAMVTAQASDIGKAAIYSADNNAPLYLVGKTIITGTVYASERKFSTGYIDGKGYEQPKLIYGEVKKSEHLIPALDTILIHEIKLLFDRQEHGYKLKYIDRIPTNTSLSFEQSETNYYFSNQSIDLEDSLSGNIIIHSAIKVRITASAALNDVLILAPEIDIDKGFKGSIQCFATRSITVGSDSKLQYPSALVLLGEDLDSTIVINHDASVEGVVIIPGYDQALGSKGIFKIEKGGFFHGMAYINGAADIQGTLWGSITARSFQANVKGAIYGNHLLNAEINGIKRSPFMPASLLWANTKELLIAKWIK